MDKENLFNNIGKSFIYMGNSKDSNTDHCRTPCLVLSQSEAILFTSLYITVLIYLSFISFNSLAVTSGNLFLNEIPVIKFLGLQIDKSLD
jgi:hypothetical protein